MIFHGPKLELKQSRCHKNQDNASIDAPLTSKNHNFWSTVEFLWSKPFQKQEVKAFPEMSRSTWSKEVWGWHPFKGYRRPYKGHYLEIRFGAIKSPGSLQTKGGSHFFFFLSFILYLVFLHIFLPSKHQNTHKNHKKKIKIKKAHQRFLILLSSPKTQGIILIPNLLFLGSTLRIWGLGVWMKLFSYHSHP